MISELLKRVYAIDVLECDECGCRMRILAVIPQSDATAAILDCLGMTPERPRCRAPPPAEDCWEANSRQAAQAQPEGSS